MKEPKFTPEDHIVYVVKDFEIVRAVVDEVIGDDGVDYIYKIKALIGRDEWCARYNHPECYLSASLTGAVNILKRMICEKIEDMDVLTCNCAEPWDEFWEEIIDERA